MTVSEIKAQYGKVIASEISKFKVVLSEVKSNSTGLQEDQQFKLALAIFDRIEP